MDAVRDAVRVLARLHRLLDAAGSGLTLPQYRMLAVLREGGERSARLAERLAVRRPTVTALADGLLAAGYAARESEPGDRRIVRLRLTEGGRRALDRAEAAYVARLAPLFAELPEPERLLSGLRELGAVLDDRQRCAPAAATSRSAPAEHPAGAAGVSRS